MATDTPELASATHRPPPAAPAQGRLSRLWDRFIAFDPAFSQLRLASRAILSLLISAAILVAVTLKFGPLPPAAYGLTAVISFNSSMAVRDKGARAQLVTRLYSMLAALAAVFAAALLSPIPVVADIGFLAVIFAAVYIRKFGPRWFAVGMIAFMAYFMGDYLRPRPQDMGWLALAAAVSFGVSQIVTNYILSSDPERDFRRALTTIDKRINLILGELLEAARDQAPVDRRTLNERVSQLRDIVLMAEGFIPQGGDGSLAARGAASDLAVALFDLQLLVERLVGSAYAALPPADLLQAVIGAPGRSIGTSPLVSLPDGDADTALATRLLLRLARARARVEAALVPAAFLPAEPKPAAKPTDEPGGKPKPAASGESRSLIPAEFYLPIQVTLASAIAIGAGVLLSSSRWYWAVLTAFIVFNNTKSRADTAMRALQRSAGTFAGLIGGTIIATLLNGQLVLPAVLIVAFFFLAFYLLQTSYSLMIFFITLALALIYGLMGSFTPQLLLLRLGETVIGSLAGVFVAFFVFPARASSGVADALDKYLKALSDLVAAARARAHGAPEPQHLLARSRLLDRAYADLANAARPLGGPWSAVTRFGGVRQRLLWLSGCAHWGRVLARSLKPGETLPAEQAARIDALADEVSTRIARAEAMKQAFFDRHRAGGEAAPVQRTLPPAVMENEDPVLALEIISLLLERASGGGAAR